MTISRLLKFFPTPTFLAMPAVGLDISDRAIRFVELYSTGRDFTLKRYGKVEIPPMVLDGGNVVNPSEFSKVLNRVRDEFKINFAHISLPEEKAYLFRTRVPDLSRREIAQLIEFKLEENVPIGAGEAIFDFELLADKDHQDHLDASVTVLPKSFVESFASAFKSSGITPLSFEVEAKAICRAVVKKGEGRTFLVAHFGNLKTVLAIVSGGIVQFTSTLSIGGDLLTAALQRHLKISKAKAEEIKRTKGLVEHKGDLELFSSLINPLSALKDEISKVLIYWNTHDTVHKGERVAIKTVIFTGEDSAMAGFDKYMEASLKSKVVIGNVWSNLFSFDNYIPSLSKRESLNFASAIGLASN